jgi:hypothetical protein
MIGAGGPAGRSIVQIRQSHRPSRRSPRLLALVALVVALSTVGTSTALGASVKRTWSASIGTSGANGSTQIYGYTTGTGFITTSLKAMGPSRTWSIGVHRGTCASLGSRIFSLGYVKTSPDGTASVNHTLTSSRMSAIWKATWDYRAVALRLVSGSSVRCATYGFARATRVVVVGMGIDLPVVEGPRSTLYCNVAMYTRELSQPGEPGVTLLYAHARTGMFLPLLTASRTNNGASMIGRTVRVYTSTSRYYTYRITQVKRHQTSIQSAFGVSTSRVLWLQTSEGPYSTSTKLVVVATQTGGPYAASYAASHPTPRPRSC